MAANIAGHTIDLSKVREINDHIWHVDSATSDDVYVVARNLHTGKITCNCEGGILGGRCWHMTAVVRYTAANLPPVVIADDEPVIDDATKARRAAILSLITGGKR